MLKGHTLRTESAHCERGVTLIELIIAVAIVGVLLSLALPSYLESIQKSRRSDAVVALNNLQLVEENYRASHTAFGTLAQIGASDTSTNGYYSLAISAITSTGYTLTATAVADKQQWSDIDCRKLILTQAGTMTTYTSFTSAATESFTCWQ